MNRSAQLAFAWLGVAIGIVSLVVSGVIAVLNGHPQFLVMASSSCVAVVLAGLAATGHLHGAQR